MPEISPEKVCLIAIHAREFQVKVAPEDLDEGSNASDDGMRVILEDYKDDSTYEQLVRALDSLRPDELSEVMAIAWTGRGDFEPEQWDEAIDQAEALTNAEAKRSLLQIPLLSTHLENGLDRFDISCEEFEPA